MWVVEKSVASVMIGRRPQTPSHSHTIAVAQLNCDADYILLHFICKSFYDS